MSAHAGSAQEPYRVLVFETDDLVPRNESELPNVLTVVTTNTPAARLQQFKSADGKPAWALGRVRAHRADLSLFKTYPTWRAARKSMRRLEERLLRQGFVVNRKAPHRRVYVVELDPTAVSDAGCGFLYVGETSKTPAARFEVHMSGAKKYSRWVRNHGVRLRPDLAPPGFFLSVHESELAEAKWRLRLENQGYVVRGAHRARELRSSHE